MSSVVLEERGRECMDQVLALSYLKKWKERMYFRCL